jgi:hypothetical protein
MADVIALIVAFICVWIVTVQLLKWSFEHDDDVMLLNMHDIRIKIIKYTPYKRYGVLLARYGEIEYTFIDKHLAFRDILEYNIGNYLFASIVTKVEGIILLDTVIYLTDVSENHYKHFDKWHTKL